MPTIRDVAHHAGVHASTVSRVLSGQATISPATRARVLEAAHLLGWKPNALARSLSQGSTNTLGLVIPPMRADSLFDPFFPPFLRTLLPTVQALGFRLLVVGAAEPMDDLDQALHLLHSRIADGMLVVLPAPLTEAAVERLRHSERPILLVGQPPSDNIGLSWVDADHEGATREAVAHLLALGHRHIAFVGGPAETSLTQQRLRGYHAALAAADVPRTPALICLTDGSRTGGAFAARALLRVRPSAFYAASELLALGVLDVLTAQRLHIPTDISVISSSTSDLADHLAPPLTTVPLPIVELAQEAARLLIALVQGRVTQPVTRLLPSLLVGRGSTAPPPAG